MEDIAPYISLCNFIMLVVVLVLAFFMRRHDRRLLCAMEEILGLVEEDARAIKRKLNMEAANDGTRSAPLPRNR